MKTRHMTRGQYIHKIKKILKNSCPNVRLVESKVPEYVNKHTELTFVERIGKSAPVYYTRTVEHFVRRGLLSKNKIQPMSLYLVMFKNKKTGKLHYKFGITNFVQVKDRFHFQSNTWQFIGEAIPARSGPRNQIVQLESRLKKFATANGIIENIVEDFSYGGKTELLIPCDRLPIDKYQQMLKIFHDDGFDSI